MRKVTAPLLLCLLVLSLVLVGCAQPTNPSPTTSIDSSLVPIATAYIAGNGRCISSSGNVGIVHTSTGVYQITVTDVTFGDAYSFLLTPARNSQTYMDGYVMTGNLFCCAYSTANTPTDTDFNISIWKNKTVSP